MPTSTLNRFPNGFPDSEEVVLQWNQRYTITSTGGAGPVYIVLAANGPFDPDVYLSAVQPNNYDDWAVQYARYLPIETRMTFKMRDIKASTAALPYPSPVGVIFGPDTQDWSAAAVTFSSAYSRARTKSAFAGRNGDTTWVMRNSADQLRGFTTAQGEGTETASAVVTANPTSLWYYNFAFAGDQDTVTDATIRLEMRIRFFARTSQNLDLLTRAQALHAAKPKPKKVAGIEYMVKAPTGASAASETKGDSKSSVAQLSGGSAMDLDSVLDDKEELERLRAYKRMFLSSGAAELAEAKAKVGSKKGT
jgi:hypothetical protein